MDKHTQHSALDDYFSSMLTAPVVEEPQVDKVSVEQTIALKPLLVEPVAMPQSEFKIAEPDGSGSLTDLDQLLGSVIDIDIAEIDLSVLDSDVSVVDTVPVEVEVVATEVITTVSNNELEVTAQETAIVENDTIVGEDAIIARVSESHEATDNEHTTISTEPELENSAELAWKNVELEERFQALFFEVAGVTFAVPLTELGGIHQIDTVNSLFGKPDWYLGIMQHRDQKLSVVDTARWVMPEQNMGEIDYKYQIQLSQSNWVLGCESLHGTETLNSNDIKWRSTPGSRPWLAGMVKSRMCVLLHVTEMIKLLDNGINIHGQ